jgi:hypothetical protein
MFRSLMELSSGIRIEIKFHTTQLAMYISHILESYKTCKKTISLDAGDIVADPRYIVYWRLPTHVLMDETVLSYVAAKHW